ncbi:hypothetical protein [Anaerosporobacter sp.]
MECNNCRFENQEESNYCQHCGIRLTSKKSMFSRDNISATGTIAGAGAKGVSVAPLAYKNGTEAGKSAPRIVITPHEDGTWFCPLCGEKNTGYSCRGCEFAR